MEAIVPINEIEINLVVNENWQQAKQVSCYWFRDNCTCDICHLPISGRHMIDGKLRNSFMFGLMCASCHSIYGDGFGEGQGQLYTHLINGKWLLTFGFCDAPL